MSGSSVRLEVSATCETKASIAPSNSLCVAKRLGGRRRRRRLDRLPAILERIPVRLDTERRPLRRHDRRGGLEGGIGLGTAPPPAPRAPTRRHWPDGRTAHGAAGCEHDIRHRTHQRDARALKRRELNRAPLRLDEQDEQERNDGQEGGAHQRDLAGQTQTGEQTFGGVGQDGSVAHDTIAPFRGWFSTTRAGAR